jgi:hypothetical protein
VAGKGGEGGGRERRWWEGANMSIFKILTADTQKPEKCRRSDWESLQKQYSSSAQLTIST